MFARVPLQCEAAVMPAALFYDRRSAGTPPRVSPSA